MFAISKAIAEIMVHQSIRHLIQHHNADALFQIDLRLIKGESSYYLSLASYVSVLECRARMSLVLLKPRSKLAKRLEKMLFCNRFIILGKSDSSMFAKLLEHYSS